MKLERKSISTAITLLAVVLAGVGGFHYWDSKWYPIPGTNSSHPFDFEPWPEPYTKLGMYAFAVRRNLQSKKRARVFKKRLRSFAYDDTTWEFQLIGNEEEMKTRRSFNEAQSSIQFQQNGEIRISQTHPNSIFAQFRFTRFERTAANQIKFFTDSDSYIFSITKPDGGDFRLENFEIPLDFLLFSEK